MPKDKDRKTGNHSRGHMHGGDRSNTSSNRSNSSRSSGDRDRK